MFSPQIIGVRLIMSSNITNGILLIVALGIICIDPHIIDTTKKHYINEMSLILSKLVSDIYFKLGLSCGTIDIYENFNGESIDDEDVEYYTYEHEDVVHQKIDYENSDDICRVSNIISDINYQNTNEMCSMNKIPLNIFQTWRTKNVPPGMALSINSIKTNNSEFKHYLYDDDDCRNFIQEHFLPDVLMAYDTLIPGAFKADLWRYCVLYILGGIYIDAKMEWNNVNNFKLTDLLDDDYYVDDIPSHPGIYNAFMVSQQKNPVLLDCIDSIVKNVKNRDYRDGALFVTGPGLLYEMAIKNNVNVFDFKLKHEPLIVLTSDNKPFLRHYTTYRKEQELYSKMPHYAELYHDRKVFRE